MSAPEPEKRRLRLPGGRLGLLAGLAPYVAASALLALMPACTGSSAASRPGSGGAVTPATGGAPPGTSGGAPGGGTGGASGGTGGTPLPTPDASVGGALGSDAGTDAAPSSDAGSRVDAGPSGTIVTNLDVTDVWSGHPVGFALLTTGNQQLAAFYDSNRQMTVAQRSLDSPSWRFVRLATSVVWDSHNYIALAVDSAGYIHIAGNMHAVPLIYFRTTSPLDISTFQRVTSMVGTNEQSCTYPQFITGPGGEFVFAYRDGVSGAGNYVFNVYDVPSKTWRRLISTPLVDGEGLRNAYPVGPTLGPDGWWHLVYVWRDTPDAATNHDLSYVKSRDLVNWQGGTGQALTLPITFATAGVIVDPVPAMGGMINNNTKVGFDSQNRPVIAYHKFDAAGNTQLYNARVEGGQWAVHQTSNWTYRWNFGGTGTLLFQIQLEGVHVDASGALVQVWYHQQYGGWSAFRVDETTLGSVATLGRTLPYPASLETVESTTPMMGVRWASDYGAGPDPGLLYMLRWETLPENMDQPRATIPPPTRLRLYGFVK